MTAPDLIFHNGEVMPASDIDVLPVDRCVVAVIDGRISAIGGADVLDLADAETRVIDLDGRTLLPGVNDGHLHVGGFAIGRPPTALDLLPSAVSTIREIAALVAERAASTPPGTWIRGRGWHAAHLRDLDGAEPTAAMLDAVAPEHPVVLTDFSGHTIWVNSAVLRAAGLDTPDAAAHAVVPVGGVARRDGTGRFTGLFQESAQGLISPYVPALTDEELEAAVRSALAEFHREGITSITDAALNPLEGSADLLGGARVFDLLHRTCHADDIAMRVNVLVTFSPIGSSLLAPTVAGLSEFEAPASSPEWFQIRGLKIFADGVPPNCTSWMHATYPTGGHGCLTVGGETDDDRVEELHAIIAAGHDAGLQVGVHVTGDRACDAVVDGLVSAIDRWPRTDPRHYLIHGPLATPEALARAAGAGIGVNVQPALKSTSALAIESMFGRELADYQWPLRTIAESGCVMASSSDAPVTTPDWRQGVATAMSREAPDGEVYGAEQRVTAAEAVRSYTAGGAWQDDAEAWKGSIIEGKVADLCVVDCRLSTDDPKTISAAPVSMTVVGGAVVHG